MTSRTPSATKKSVKQREKYREDAEHRNAVKAKSREWAEKNRTRTNENARLWRLNRPRNKALWYTAKNRAKLKGIEFTITPDDIFVPKFCPVLGIELVVSSGHDCSRTPSIDRIDPARGYVPGNITVMSHRANTLKNNASFAEIERLFEYMRVFA